MKNSNYHYSFYISEEQEAWLDKVAKLNGKSKSFMIRVAIDLLRQAIGDGDGI